MKETTRLTIESPTTFHKRLKAIAALQGKSMRDIILEQLSGLVSDESTEQVAEKLMNRYEEAFKKMGKG